MHQKLGFLSKLLDYPVTYLPGRLSRPIYVAGWGNKRSGKLAKFISSMLGVRLLRLEDGFVRSFNPGLSFPGLSLVADAKGIFYDSNSPSDLEILLSREMKVSLSDRQEFLRDKADMLNFSISKYNNARPGVEEIIRSSDASRVLVVDQTFGDLSVLQGGAESTTFHEMLEAAIHENPKSTIYLKTHPQVTAGVKSGYLSDVPAGEKIVLLPDLVDPHDLIRQMDRVYVVSSGMGFEALLLGKPVTCFGIPWYSGWGVTDDRKYCPRRSQRHTVDDLFIAAYGLYTRYLDPDTRKRGSLRNVLVWMKRQRNFHAKYPARMIAVGFKPKKVANLKNMLSLSTSNIHFAADTQEAAQLQPEGQDCLICWGRIPPKGLEALAMQTGVRLLRMEDGFVRSVGLGSDHVPPMSFVLDARGIYFDPGQPSDLELLLNEHEFTYEDIDRAKYVRSFIVQHGITKYNLEPLCAVNWQNKSSQKVVLVPGQVEDDASIRYGCDPEGVRTNLGLLEAARQEFPDAYIVYKPHPDVSSGNRVGVVHHQSAMQLADYVEMKASVVSCIDACDVVVTMTSLTGFDALLRGKQVIVHGRPFYAGWGLTTDVIPVPRRSRTLSLDQLVACAMLHYPLYWDEELKGFASCEAVLHRVLEQRMLLAQRSGLQRMKADTWRRMRSMARKIKTTRSR